jgi:hypothetical protein
MGPSVLVEDGAFMIPTPGYSGYRNLSGEPANSAAEVLRAGGSVSESIVQEFAISAAIIGAPRCKPLLFLIQLIGEIDISFAIK